MASSSFYWEKPLFESSYERRRLRILNSIFLAFARVGGGSAYVRDRDAREISISGPAGVSITLDTPKKRQARNRRSDDADAKDKLELRAEGGRHHPDIVSNWIDDDAGKLEDKLTEIVIGLAIVSERESRRWQAEMAQWRRKREEEEAEARRKAKEKAEREEREQIAAEEKARRNRLIAEAENWRSARLIREYVEAKRASEAAKAVGFEDWARWALKEADRMDRSSTPNLELTLKASNIVQRDKALARRLEFDSVERYSFRRTNQTYDISSNRSHDAGYAPGGARQLCESAL